MAELLSILVIEDDPDDVFFLTDSLNKLRAKDIQSQTKIATSLEEAIQALNDQEFNLIITDLFLSDSDGLDTFLELQKRANSIPILIVGRYAEEELIRETIKLGAQDYLSKTDLNVDLLSRIIHHAIERQRLHVSLRALSFTDELTGLYNRRGFLTLLDQQIALARRMKKGFYLFLIDLDYLKQINDTHGHLFGDHALVDMAQCLRASFRRHDLIGRIGGDEFAVVAINASRESGDYLKQHMIDKTKEYNTHIKEPYQLSFSIGKVYYDGLRDVRIEALFQEADHELYQEKRVSHAKEA